MDGLTLTRSLRAAELCDLAEHRSMRPQGEARICEKRALGQPRNGTYQHCLTRKPWYSALPSTRSPTDSRQYRGPKQARIGR